MHQPLEIVATQCVASEFSSKTRKCWCDKALEREEIRSPEPARTHQPAEIPSRQTAGRNLARQISSRQTAATNLARKIRPRQTAATNLLRKFLPANRRQRIWCSRFPPAKLREQIWHKRFLSRGYTLTHSRRMRYNIAERMTSRSNV